VYDEPSREILSAGVDIDLELAVCRRLIGDSCPHDGVRPLTLVDLLPTIDVAPTVIVEVGYNDFENTFADSVEQTLQAIEKAGVKRVLWLTLRAERSSYINMNAAIRAAVAAHPEVTIVDWNAYSRNHPDWFVADGLHLNPEGAFAMATLVHKSLDALGLVKLPAGKGPAITTRTLPAARVGKKYLVRLSASGGTRPVRWSLRTGALPAGVHLLPDGWLTGTPRSTGSSKTTFRAMDAKGRSASRTFVIAVRSR
jgi:hypothetical protein